MDNVATVARLDTRIDNCVAEAKEAKAAVMVVDDKFDIRLRTVERLCWMALGGIFILVLFLSYIIAAAARHQ